jgi:hypothetical protein
MEEGRRKMEEGRGKREEGRGKKEEGRCSELLALRSCAPSVTSDLRSSGCSSASRRSRLSTYGAQEERGLTDNVCTVGPLFE